MTADQKKALEGFRKARLEERTAFREKMAQLREEMRGLAGDPQANQAKIDALIDTKRGLSEEILGGAGGGEAWLTEMPSAELLRLVSLDLHTAVEEG